MKTRFLHIFIFTLVIFNKAFALGNAVLSSPVNNSTLASSSVTFSWSNTGADNYGIRVGTAANDGQYFDDTTTGTSLTVNGLPTDGSTLYVKLFTNYGSTWTFNQYTFKASNTSILNKAVLSSPINNSTLASSSVAFSWNNTGADNYGIRVGTAANDGQYFDDTTTGTSLTVNGLPTDGSTLYVKLFTNYGSTWIFNQYTFKAYTLSGGGQIPAFPNAQGDGSLSKGGRGGKTLIVDRLDDPCPTVACTTEDLNNINLLTPGTLRWALLQPYPRTVIFRKSGVISLQPDKVSIVNNQINVDRLSNIRIKSPYLTIAGQTAPQGGITIRNAGITVLTHNVVIRYIKFRTGKGSIQPYVGQQIPETLMIENNSYNVIIDHCSINWMPAEGVSVYTGHSWDGSVGTAKDITLSWNMIGEGLVADAQGRGHPSAAFMSGFDVGDEAYASERITLHHNFLFHSQKRNGDLLTKSGRITNNIFYNWQWLPTVLAGGVRADLIGNIWKTGPFSNSTQNRPIHIVPAGSSIGINNPYDWWVALPGQPSLYLASNAFGNGSNIPSNQKDLICYYRNFSESCQVGLIQSSWFRAQPLPYVNGIPVNISTSTAAEQQILNMSGAYQRINERGAWVANRDQVELRYINEYLQGGYLLAALPTHENQVGGYNTTTIAQTFADTDKDGISDLWERTRGLNPNNSIDAAYINANGYSNLELFMNGDNPI